MKWSRIVTTVDAHIGGEVKADEIRSPEIVE